jgi:hypothetical protein
MGTSAVLTPTRNIAVAKAYLDANGFDVSESLPYGKVHRVHTDNSFHYDEGKVGSVVHTLAFDLNWPGSASTERTKLIGVIPALQSMGISIIYARDGSNGSAASHKTHLHGDVGSWTNLGLKNVKTKPGSLYVYDTQIICHMSKKTASNLDSAETVKRLKAIQQASKMYGTKFPYGIKYTQTVLGVPLTGKWDDASKSAHNKAVKALETLWKKDKLFVGTPDTTWSSATDNALAAFHKKY